MNLRLHRANPFLKQHFRLFEAAGMILIFVAAALELIAIRDSDRHRVFFEQTVQGQALLDEVTYRAFWLKEQLLLLQYPSVPRLKDFASSHADITDRFEELANHSLDTYQMIWLRADAMNQRIGSFRSQVGLGESEEVSRARTNLAGLKSATEAIRKELRLEDGTLKFPITHLREGELLAASARENTMTAAGKTTTELEQRRSARSSGYFVLFLIGSFLLVAGKYGNWLRELPPPAAQAAEQIDSEA